MSKQQQSTPKNVDLNGVQAALIRAAARAHEIAAQTGTCVIQVVDGKVQRIQPKPIATAKVDSNPAQVAG